MGGVEAKHAMATLDGQQPLRSEDSDPRPLSSEQISGVPSLGQHSTGGHLLQGVVLHQIPQDRPRPGWIQGPDPCYENGPGINLYTATAGL